MEMVEQNEYENPDCSTNQNAYEAISRRASEHVYSSYQNHTETKHGRKRKTRVKLIILASFLLIISSSVTTLLVSKEIYSRETAIRCSASHFEGVNNGAILGYNEFYVHGQYMELQCDEGFATPDRVYRVRCEDSDSFSLKKLVSFQCKAIYCKATGFENVSNGMILNYTDVYNYGQYMELQCDDGYVTGDGVYKVRCEDSVSFDPERLNNFRCKALCPAPCVPVAARLLHPLPMYKEGDVVEFTCEGNATFGGSSRRECLRNGQWSGEPIDCYGGRSLQFALDNFLHKFRSMSIVNGTDVHIYLSLDVTWSMFLSGANETMKTFVTTLLQSININNATLLERPVYAFVTYAFTLRNEHGDGEMEDILANMNDPSYCVHNTDGDVAEIANDLKSDSFNLEILSVCIPYKQRIDGINLMKELASEPKIDHFFLINYDREMALNCTGEMCMSCGCTKPGLADYTSTTFSTISKPYAWPWMVIFANRLHTICLGSLIDSHWILTSADCAHPGIDRFDLHEFNGVDDDHMYRRVSEVIFHDGYNSTVEPEFYDIALVYTKPEIPFSPDIHSVCLNITDEHYNDVFSDSNSRYGVGLHIGNGLYGIELYQYKTEIQSEKCLTMMNQTENIHLYNSSRTFCAIGKFLHDVRPILYKGGPFVVPYPDDQPGKENHFVQVGIVFDVKPCGNDSLCFIILKLTAEHRRWIINKVNEKATTRD